MKNFIKDKGAYIIGIIIILLVWEMVSLIYQNDIVFPTLGEITKRFGEVLISKRTYIVLLSTMFRLLISVIISIVLGSILAFISYKNKMFKKLIAPLMTILKSIPVASFIIIILIIVGHEKSSVLISMFVMMPIIYEGVLSAFDSIKKEVIEDIKTISNTNTLIIKDMYIPMMKPLIITAFLQSFSLGLKSLVMSEVLTMPKYSIGSELLGMKNNLDMAGVMAWTIILILISILIELLLNKEKEKARVVLE